MDRDGGRADGNPSAFAVDSVGMGVDDSRSRGGTSSGDGPDQPEDPELLRRVGRGDEDALAALYSRYGGLVYTLALRIVGDPELAREVLQDTFFRCWDGHETFDPSRGRVPWWLMGIARNRAIDLLRSRPHQARLREQAPLTGQEREGPGGAEAAILRRTVTNALQALSAVQREAIELAYYGGLTQAEIARTLEEPLGTIKSRTREAMERLRQLLGPSMEPRGGA
jgi:RNA polymerase sigma-70 factor, ECF subfamily